MSPFDIEDTTGASHLYLYPEMTKDWEERGRPWVSMCDKELGRRKGVDAWERLESLKTKCGVSDHVFNRVVQDCAWLACWSKALQDKRVRGGETEHEKLRLAGLASRKDMQPEALPYLIHHDGQNEEIVCERYNDLLTVGETLYRSQFGTEGGPEAEMLYHQAHAFTEHEKLRTVISDAHTVFTRAALEAGISPHPPLKMTLDGTISPHPPAPTAPSMLRPDPQFYPGAFYYLSGSQASQTICSETQGTATSREC